MPNLQTSALGFPSASRLGQSNTDGVPGGIMGELVLSQLAGRYSALVAAGKVFSAYGALTAPVAYGTAAGIGGPLLWNRPGSNVDAHILAIGLASSVVSTVAGGLGITGNAGQAVAPTAVTAIDAKGNMLVGGAAPAVESYRLGTVAQAGDRFFPFAQLHTGALTVGNTLMGFVDIGGLFVIPPGAWGSVAGSALLSTLQAGVSVIWTELPSR